jgi:hypothetical protein
MFRVGSAVCKNDTRNIRKFSIDKPSTERKVNMKTLIFNWREIGRYWRSNGNKHHKTIFPDGY